MFSLLADVVVVLHAVYVGFCLFALVFIFVGAVLRWRWVRNFYFRLLHVTMMTVVACEAGLGLVCPLTTLENYLREKAGETPFEASFFARLAHDLLFFDAPQWMFNVGHVTFGIIVLATFVLVPPRWPWRKGRGMTPSA